MALVHSRPFSPRVFDESPWFEPLECLVAGLRALADFPSVAFFDALYEERVRGTDAPPLRFVLSPPKTRKRRRREPVDLAALYEGSIVERHEVPTRAADWHDFFNALAFCAFPRAKWALHERQYRIYQERVTPGARRLPSARTREQDALALFDEGGLVLALDAEAMRELPHDPDGLEPRLRELVRGGRGEVTPFGHALYEHLVAGLPAPLGYVYLVSRARPGLRGLERLDALDRALRDALVDPHAFTAPHGARGLSLADLERDARAGSAR